MIAPDMIAQQPNLTERRGYEYFARMVEVCELAEAAVLARVEPVDHCSILHGV